MARDPAGDDKLARRPADAANIAIAPAGIHAGIQTYDVQKGEEKTTQSVRVHQ